MKLHLIYIAVFWLMGCNTKQVLVGSFASKSSPVGLYIKSDSTFFYKYYELHAYEYSTGRWYKKRNNKIVLNSYLKDVSIPLSLIRAKHDTNDTLNRLSVNFQSDNIEARDCECAFFFDRKLKEIRRCDSISMVILNYPFKELFLEVRKSPLLLTSLLFSVDPLITNVYTPPYATGNSLMFEVVVKDSLFSYRVFDKVAVKIKEDELKYFDSKQKRKITIPRLNKE